MLRVVKAINFALLNGSNDVSGVTVIVDNTNPVRNNHFVLLDCCTLTIEIYYIIEYIRKGGPSVRRNRPFFIIRG
jgi:hypothetical protein